MTLFDQQIHTIFRDMQSSTDVIYLTICVISTEQNILTQILNQIIYINKKQDWSQILMLKHR